LDIGIQNIVEKAQPLHQNLLGTLDIHMYKTESRPLSYSISQNGLNAFMCCMKPKNYMKKSSEKHLKT
jgi:hypothetical protein